MPTTSPSDLLPFALPGTIGLPYHGLVSGGDYDATPKVAGTLALPGALTRSYPQPSDGGAILVQHPRHSTASRSAEAAANDLALGRQWLEYGLLSGVQHQIGGQEIGEEYHLYCDSDYTWRIRIKQTQGLGSCKVQVYLAGLFGVASDVSRTITETLLAEETWTPLNQNGNPMSSLYLGGYSLRTYSKTGNKVVLMVGTYFQSGFSGSGLQAVTTQHQSLDRIYVHDIVTVTISGDGSLEAGSVGSGITATIGQVAALPLETLTITSEGDTTLYTKTTTYLRVVTPDGNDAAFEYEMADVTTIVTDDGPPVVKTITIERTHTATFGGSAVVGVDTYDGTWEAGRNPANQGTYCQNSVCTSWTYQGSGEIFYPPVEYMGIGMQLPLAVYVEPANVTPTALFAGGGSQAVTTASYDQNWAFNPATSVLTTSDDNVCYV